MKNAILKRCVITAVIALLVSAVISGLILQSMRQNEIETSMRLMLNSVKNQITYDLAHNTFSPQDEVKKYTDYRLSIIQGDGKVLADNEAVSETMENHADRPEFIEAKATGTGTAVRYSATLKKNETYVAMKVNDDLYVRLAMENRQANTIFASILPALLIGIAVAGILTPVMAKTIARDVTEPLIQARNQIEDIATGERGEVLPNPKYEELVPIVDSVNTLSARISAALKQLQSERERSKTLLDNMEEGLVVIDSRLRVVSTNLASERYLGGTNALGKNLMMLTRNERILSAVQAAVAEGRSTIFDLNSYADDSVILSAHITPARGSIISTGTAQEENGAIILLTNVTTLRETEKLRSEFVANASHELKTPITSIKGFAELLAAGLVSDPEKTADYLNRITAEAARMTTLINDIIKISELESGCRPEANERVNLKKLAEEIGESLLPAAGKKNVSIEVTGDDISLTASREDMRQIVGNLMDNAVKYNVSGGSVRVLCKKQRDGISLTVADTGIGIASKHHGRIFERFYCVDKGRSRTVGGTGLGLSIVKHAVARWGGEILFQSAEGEGTTITVVFKEH
ncbi:ATP-binding protein [Acetanaerobacterium elongatum]|uniref:histidine kinase n=1 Tax=Acetanaerobacterium elongatum TaxID=258515 RepID=A0A1H0GXL8_9FIRM|nr:ATP-binding protein [Acetanaerobacterium elongatum]SDO11534.1 two-component system, OmpR family, phosphate regulon sensor histidine kinase PhoR [Acetanaerobacterium elongatum]